MNKHKLQTTKGKVILSDIKIQVILDLTTKLLVIHPLLPPKRKYYFLFGGRRGWITSMISVSFINFRINTSISIHITRRLKTWYIRILWLLYIDKLDKFIFQKKGWKLFIQSITEQQFVEFAKILPPDWLKKILIIHFVGINKLNVFAGYLPTEN